MFRNAEDKIASITTSYNKHSGITYAYETSYEWDTTKIQRRRCIGHLDRNMGKIVPDSSQKQLSLPDESNLEGTLTEIAASLSQREQILQAFAENYQNLGKDIHQILAEGLKPGAIPRSSTD